MGFFFKTKIELAAPVTGTLLPLEQVKDQAFAEKMLGDGVAVAPETGEILAPCDGILSYVPDTAHAVALTGPHGLEILIHVGLDTVKLEGRGFTAHVKTGDNVKRGQSLISFDRAQLLAEGYDVTTPMVITNGDVVSKMEKAPASHVTAGDSTVVKVTLK